MLACSFLLHVALLAIVVTFRLYPEAHPLAEETYYVDMVSLPVASPAKGTPAPTATTQQPAAPQAAPEPPRPAPQSPAPAKAAPPASRPSMTYPTAKTKPTTSKQKQVQSDETAPTGAEAKAFQDRMAKLERQAEDRRQADVLARLRKGTGGKKGAPTGSGTQAGSDYAAYIHSRLKDAFVDTIASQTKSPQVTVRLVIGPDGRIAQYKVENSSGDKMFEDAVDRAVHVAERSFRKPPGGTPFEQGFVFRPQGVGLK
ncbi:energy transducer TonB [Geomesophilobacter sediminis]|nr:energy transducer TonB [Geomesophilobacter sediminis]